MCTDSRVCVLITGCEKPPGKNILEAVMEPAG